MDSEINHLMSALKKQQISRRTFLSSLTALAVAGFSIKGRQNSAFAAANSAPPIPVEAINHMTISVSDPTASVAWYQGLFGMPIAARQGGTIVLQVGNGPQFIAIGGSPSDNPRITHYCLEVDNFDHERIVEILAENGVAATVKNLVERPPAHQNFISATRTVSSYSYRIPATVVVPACKVKNV